MELPRIARLATAALVVLLAADAGPVAARVAADDKPGLEQLVQQAWRWRELQREHEPPAFHSVAFTPGGELVIADRDGLWRYDGIAWTQPPGWGAFAGVRVGILYAGERGLVLAANDRLYGVPAGGTPGPGDRTTPDELALTGRMDPKASAGLGFLPDGTPLVARDGQVQRIWPDGLMALYELPPNRAVSCVAVDGASRVWCVTESGLWLREGAAWQPVPLPPDCMKNEMLWRATAVGGHLVLLPRVFDPRERGAVWDGHTTCSLPVLPDGGVLTDVASTQNRELVVALEGSGLRVLRDDVWHEAPVPPPFQEPVQELALAPDLLRLAAVTQQGRLLVCDLVSSRWEVFDTRPLGLSGLVNVLCRSSRGGVWVGAHAGLARWDEGFTDVHLRADDLDLDLDVITGIAEDDQGQLWCGSGSRFAGALRFDGTTWHRHQEPEGIGDQRVHTIRRAPDGGLWFALLANDDDDWPSGAIVRYQDGTWTRFDKSTGDPGTRAYDLLWTPDGELLAGLYAGLARFDGQRFQPLPDTGLRESERAFALHLDGYGDLWVGLGLGWLGVSRQQGGAWERLRGPDWELVSANAFAETSDGTLWISSDRGLQRVKDGLPTQVDCAGALCSPTFWPVLATDDGRSLLLGSRGTGLVRYTPDDVAPPRVTYCNVANPSDLPDDVILARWEGADAWNVTASDRLRYSYRIDDEPWSSWSPVGRGSNQLRRSRVSPGEHRLAVRAMDAAGNVSPEPRVEGFTVEAPFWARTPMLVALTLLVITVASLALLGARRRREQRQTHRELARLNAQLHRLAAQLLTSQEAERRNLARDLHDDLGQVLTAACLNIQHAARTTEQGPRGEALQRAYEAASKALEGVRCVVSRLRPPLLDDLGLAVAIRATVDDFRKDTGIDAHARVDLGQQELPATAASHVFRIVNECLTNAARHSGARRIEVRLAIRGSRLRLAVRDDGRGFDPALATARQDGMGLMGMRERAESLGGTLSVDSAAGRGTSIHASIPLREGADPEEEERSDDSWTHSESSSWTTT